jgi:hypothetical protein
MHDEIHGSWLICAPETVGLSARIVEMLLVCPSFLEAVKKDSVAKIAMREFF